MLNEQSSVWFVPTADIDEFAVLLKCPAHIHKAIIDGSKVQLIFGTHSSQDFSVLCYLIKIFDIESSPISIRGAIRHIEEQNALFRILDDCSTSFFLFDELSHCVSSGRLSIPLKKKKKISNFISKQSHIYSGNFSDEIKYALDCFDSTLNLPFIKDEGKEYPSTPSVCCDIHLTNFINSEIYSYSIHESDGFSITQKDEGKGFEQSGWQALESIFLGNIYKST